MTLVLWLRVWSDSGYGGGICEIIHFLCKLHKKLKPPKQQKKHCVKMPSRRHGATPAPCAHPIRSYESPCVRMKRHERPGGRRSWRPFRHFQPCVNRDLGCHQISARAMHVHMRAAARKGRPGSGRPTARRRPRCCAPYNAPHTLHRGTVSSPRASNQYLGIQKKTAC